MAATCVDCLKINFCTKMFHVRKLPCETADLKPCEWDTWDGRIPTCSCGFMHCDPSECELYKPKK